MMIGVYPSLAGLGLSRIGSDMMIVVYPSLAGLGRIGGVGLGKGATGTLSPVCVEGNIARLQSGRLV